MKHYTSAAVLGSGALALFVGVWSCRSAISSNDHDAHGEGDRFPADLGPAQVDVARYPKARQEDYALFVERCSGCHTLARAINSPVKDSATWTRYVTRMHVKNEAQTGKALLSDLEARRIVWFLVFDSRERKIKEADRFEVLQKELLARFEKEEAARGRENASAERLQANEPASPPAFP